MKKYRIELWFTGPGSGDTDIDGDSRELDGYSVADYFSDDSLRKARDLASSGDETAANKMLLENYLGEDVHGIGVSWETLDLVAPFGHVDPLANVARDQYAEKLRSNHELER